MEQKIEMNGDRWDALQRGGERILGLSIPEYHYVHSKNIVCAHVFCKVTGKLTGCLVFGIWPIKCENLGKISTLNCKGWWNISGRLFRVFKQFHQMCMINANLPTWLLAVLEPIWPSDGKQRAWELLGFSFHLVTQDLQSVWKSWAFSKWFFRNNQFCFESEQRQFPPFPDFLKLGWCLANHKGHNKYQQWTHCFQSWVIYASLPLREAIILMLRPRFA